MHFCLRSEMYGAFYEVDKDPNQMGKKLKDTGELWIIYCSLLFTLGTH